MNLGQVVKLSAVESWWYRLKLSQPHLIHLRNNLTALRKDTETSSLECGRTIRSPSGAVETHLISSCRHAKAHEVLAGVNMFAIL